MMKIKKLISGALSLCLAVGAVQLTNAAIPASGLNIYGEKGTEGTYKI